MSNACPLIATNALTISVGQRTLVRDLTMNVNAGEVWCILGANGAGKTLFLNTLVGLRKADGGIILFSGRPLDQWPGIETARARAFLPQHIHDTFSATVLDTVLMGRHPHLSRWAWESESDRDVALAALHTVGLADMAQRDITTLSGGERQRAAIAALLAQDTSLLLLDEPVAHLDLRHQILVLAHLARLARAREKAVIFSAHNLNLAFRFASHALLFHGDGVVDAGPIKEVMNEAALSHAFDYPVAQFKVGEKSFFAATNGEIGNDG